MALELDEIKSKPLLDVSAASAGKDDGFLLQPARISTFDPAVLHEHDAASRKDGQGPSITVPSFASSSAVPRSRQESRDEAGSGPLRVTRVKVEGKHAINRVEMSFSDGSVWAMGAPIAGGKNKPGKGNKKNSNEFRPLVLAEDEYIIEVQHESLMQWWWVGAGVRFTTNKGRFLQSCGFWSSGLRENTQVFRASPGNAILGLRLHNGMCHGVIEGPAPDVDESALKLWAVHWLAEGAPNSEIQSRSFIGRESALGFAEQVGGGREVAYQCGPLKISVSDHPWFDCLRDARDLLRPSRLASLDAAPEAREVASSSTGESFVEFAMAGERVGAGIVLDLVKSSRVKAWGPLPRRKHCEELAADLGQFNLKRWMDMSLSLAETVERLRSVQPGLKRLFVMMDLRRHLMMTLLTAIIAATMSIADSVKTVLTGAVFTLINASAEEVKRESRFLHIICSWTFGCGSRLSLAKSLILGLMLLALCKSTVNVLSQHVAKAFKDSYRVQTRSELFDHLLAQDLEEFEKQTAKVMADKARPVVIDAMPNMIIQLVRSVTELATSLVFLYSISPLMTFMYATVVPALQVGAQAFLRRQAKGSERRERGMENVANRVVGEASDMIKVVKTFSREDWHLALQKLSLEEAATMKLTAAQGLAQVGADTMQQGIYCLSLWLGLIWVNVDSSAAEMTAFLLLVNKLGNQVKAFKLQIEDLFNKSDSLAEHFEFLDQQPKIFPGTHAGDVIGRVEFQDVSFAYPARPEQKVLHQLSIELHPGKTTALVGASGSGKSTTVQLIFRYYDPLDGRILIDDVPLTDWDLAHLHRSMALVAQEPVLFNTSVRQNLLYGLPDCRIDSDPKDFEDQIVEAAKAACAHDFIMKFPGGYDTNVGDKGGQVSGGQKQRLSIARAILMRPRILVLDEATSALDSESEGVVQEALDRLVSSSGSSVMVIAHRLSTVRKADEIICMREGHVVERGAPQALMDLKGYYFKLVENQAVTIEDIRGANVEMDQSLASEPPL